MNQDLAKKLRKYAQQRFEKYLQEIGQKSFWERLKLAWRILWA